ncbi:MAG: hypothetical protein II878_06890 [Bacteroidales bacterium]|nr:hypothetical protein [Bacteroidales bacterium]
MNKEKTIKTLQFFVTNLSNQAFSHKLQGKIFSDAGFEKLGEKYSEHHDEEMGWVDKFIDRILDLGGEIKLETRQEVKLVNEPCEYLKNELQISVDGIELLRKCMAEVCEDVTTFDIMKEYLKDEEEDMYWTEQQLDLIEKIGYQNWLIKQM